METLTDRQRYRRDYYKRNRTKILQQQKEWREAHPDKVALYHAKSWIRRLEALQKNGEIG